MATFAAGLLAGSLFWPDAPPARDSGARTPRDDRRGFVGDTRTPGGAPRNGSDDGNGARTPADPGANADASVRDLTRGAEASLARIGDSAQTQGVLSGNGKIAGTVRDSAGRPVAGVVVTALPEAQPFDVTADRRRARARGHKDRDLSRVAAEAIELELWRRNSRHTARTGSDGRFALDGLMDARHNVTAFHNEYAIEPLARGRARVQPDAVVDFLARRVAEVPVTIRLSEGASADHAWLVWRTENDRGREAWTQAHDKLRLPVGTVHIKAEVWTPAPLESEETEVVVRAGEPNARVELALEGRRVLSVHLRMPPGLVQPRNVAYRLRLIQGGAGAGGGSDDLDPASLLRDRAPKKPWSRDPGHAYWFDLEPGRYMIAAFAGGRRLLAHAEAEVKDGATEVSLEVSADDLGKSIAVRLLGPDGGPVPGRAGFRILTTTKGRTRQHRADALQRDDGSWMVLLDGVPPGDTREATLRVTSQYGAASEPFSMRAGGTVTIRLGKPAVVKLRVGGYAGSGVEGALYAGLRADGGRSGQGARGGAGAWGPVGADGTAELRSQPGTYKLQLVVRRNNKNWVVLVQPARLTAGDKELTVQMPVLHTVRVRWAGGGKPRNVVLRCTDPILGGFRRDAPLRGKKASFALLAAGQYELRIGPKRKTVRVPTAEVVLE